MPIDHHLKALQDIRAAIDNLTSTQQEIVQKLDDVADSVETLTGAVYRVADAMTPKPGR